MSILNRILLWNLVRKVPRKFNVAHEAGNIAEELSELLRSKDEVEAVDALCDIIVFATGAMWKLGYDPEVAMEETLKEIEDRAGEFDTRIGKWVKEEKPERYIADYTKALMTNE